MRVNSPDSFSSVIAGEMGYIAKLAVSVRLVILYHSAFANRTDEVRGKVRSRRYT